MRYDVMSTCKLAGRRYKPGEQLEAPAKTAAPLVASGSLVKAAEAAEAGEPNVAAKKQPKPQKADTSAGGRRGRKE